MDFLFNAFLAKFLELGNWILYGQFQNSMP